MQGRASVDSQKTEICDIPEDVLILILSYVLPEDLLYSCSRVCRDWNSLISGHIIWKRKCQRDGKIIPRYVFKSIPKNYYRNIYLRNPYGRNLVRNPFGAEQKKYWIAEFGCEGRWIVEDKPVGADSVPDEAGGKSCFVTCAAPCQKYQLIDLLKEGANEEILDKLRPDIKVGEWHASRFDCGSLYCLKIVLLDTKHSEIDMFECGPIKEEQWAGRAWTKVEYVFTDYTPGVRFIHFEHTGRDTQFWTGHYGSKMTGGYVKLVLKE